MKMGAKARRRGSGRVRVSLLPRLARWAGVGVFILGVLLNCDGDGTGPEPYDGPWEVVPCPEGPSYLNGVFFLNPDLGYAVGCDYVLRYDGSEWKTDYKYPEKEGNKLGHYYDVWFNASDDGWVVGAWYDEEINTRKGLIMHYDGVTWRELGNIPGSISWQCVLFLDDNNGWVGGNGIARWDGKDWQYETDIGLITDMYFNSPTDGWAVSKYSERIYHYDGSTWTRVHDDPWGIELRSIFFTNPDYGWAGGDGCISGTQSNLLEYRNGEWRYYLTEPWAEGIRRSIYALHFSNANNGWAVGQRTFRWDGVRWWFGDDPPLSTRGMLYDVFTVTEYDAWAVGDARTILHYQSNDRR